jgi:hypothetical protein
VRYLGRFSKKCYSATTVTPRQTLNPAPAAILRSGDCAPRFVVSPVTPEQRRIRHANGNLDVESIAGHRRVSSHGSPQPAATMGRDLRLCGGLDGDLMGAAARRQFLSPGRNSRDDSVPIAGPPCPTARSLGPRHAAVPSRRPGHRLPVGRSPSLIGVPLAICWRQSGNLAVRAFVHAMIDAVRNALRIAGQISLRDFASTNRPASPIPCRLGRNLNVPDSRTVV